MQEVFEEIKNALHKEDLEFMQQSDLMDCIDSIIDKIAAEHNDGWIPCSERLPEEYEDVEVTVEEIADEAGGKRHYTVRSWLQDGQWVIKKNPYHPTVIAWKYPTEPYQQKGEWEV